MGFWFILVSTMLYTGAAISFAAEKQWPMMIVYTGYAFANIGFLMMARSN